MPDNCALSQKLNMESGRLASSDEGCMDNAARLAPSRVAGASVRSGFSKRLGPSSRMKMPGNPGVYAAVASTRPSASVSHQLSGHTEGERCAVITYWLDLV